MKNNYDTRDKRSKPGRPARQHRHNNSDIPDVPILSERINDRKRLADLRKWVQELNQTQSYRWIAKHTWRGIEAAGYFQRIANGEHMAKSRSGSIGAKPPAIRPCWQDWHDLKQVRQAARDFADADAGIFDKALAIVQARAALDGAIADLLTAVRRGAKHEQP